MLRNKIRIRKLEIEDFKNVQSGRLILDFPRKRSTGSIMGNYGPNGSGKTAVIDALQILRDLLCGNSLSDKTVWLIHQGSDRLRIRAEFEIKDDHGEYRVQYFVEVGKKTMPGADDSEDSEVPDIKNEKLSYSWKNGCKEILEEEHVLSESFNAGSESESFPGSNGDIQEKMMNQTWSYFFSKELLQQHQENTARFPDDQTLQHRYHILYFLNQFGEFGLSVIDAGKAAASLTVHPGYFYDFSRGILISEKPIELSMESPVILSGPEYDLANKVIQAINIVLKQIVPGMEVIMQITEKEVLHDNREAFKIRLLSSRKENGKTVTIPLEYESKGIRKIISLLPFLMEALNSPAAVLAVDDLDSGIFELLFGELLSLFEENGRGQLIFTSSNLRPLETMSNSCAVFAAMNPSGKYVQLTSTKAKKNLRDVYIRKALLGDDIHDFCPSFWDSRTLLAMIRAGKLFDPA